MTDSARARWLPPSRSPPMAVLTWSTSFAYRQVTSRTFALFRVAKSSVCAVQRDFCSGFDSRQLHQENNQRHNLWSFFCHQHRVSASVVRGACPASWTSGTPPSPPVSTRRARVCPPACRRPDRAERTPAYRGSRGLYAAAAVARSGGSPPICCSAIFLIVDHVDVNVPRLFRLEVRIYCTARRYTTTPPLDWGWKRDPRPDFRSS